MKNTGFIDSKTKTTREVGKFLGADAVIAETFVKTIDWLAEVNARLIKLEDAKIIVAFSRS